MQADGCSACAADRGAGGPWESCREPETHEPIQADAEERAIEELHAFKLVAGYLFVCFAVLMFYESTLPGGAEAGVFSLGTAAIKAAILAKFLLLGQALGVGEKAHVTRVGPAIFAKSVQLWLLVIALSVVEELLVGRYQDVAIESPSG